MNAHLVPDPSSRDNTLTYSLASKSVVAAGASSAVVSAAASAVVSADVLVSAVLSEPNLYGILRFPSLFFCLCLIDNDYFKVNV